VGDPDNLHPTNKQAVGHRLALIAEAKVYGQPVEWSGPTPVNVRADSTAIRVHFSHAEGGLVVRGGAVTSLEIAAADGKYVSAEGKIEGEDLIIWSPGMRNPSSARYAWSNAPAADLYNQSDLPAAPFEWSGSPRTR
jgi:sialate O-acetylesterase